MDVGGLSGEILFHYRRKVSIFISGSQLILKLEKNKIIGYSLHIQGAPGPVYKNFSPYAHRTFYLNYRNKAHPPIRRVLQGRKSTVICIKSAKMRCYRRNAMLIDIAFGYWGQLKFSILLSNISAHKYVTLLYIK